MKSVLLTQLTPEECQKRLADAVLSEFRMFKSSSGNPDIVGKVKYCRFRLRLRRWFFNQFQHHLYGRLEETDTGTRIVMWTGFRTHDWLALFATIAIFGGAFVYFTQKGDWNFGEIEPGVYMYFPPQALVTGLIFCLSLFLIGWFGSRDDPKDLEAFVRKTLHASPALRS